jgi:aconitate decarboxylase
MLFICLEYNSSDNIPRSEIETKTHALAKYGGITDLGKVDSIIKRAWNLEDEMDVKGFVF